MIQGFWTKQARKRAKRMNKNTRKGGGKKMTLLFWPSWHVRCFWKPFFAHGRKRTHGPKRRRCPGVLNLCVACCGTVCSLAIFPSHPWLYVLISFPFYLDSKRASFWIFSCVHPMCARCVVMFYFCVLHALHEDLLDRKIQCPTVGVLCENCVIAQSCVFEVSWGMKKYTWCWSGYIKFTLSKVQLLKCAAMQPMLSSVAVPGDIWHAALALPREKDCLNEPMKKESCWLLWGATELQTLFSKPLNEHILWNRAKKK